MSEAYASTLSISFDVRGGLLMRQIHHWAAILFVSAIVCHLLRVFFTGAFRKPREFNWLIGVVLFTLAFTEGLFGYLLPDDLLSGTGLRILEGVLLSIPIVGTYLSFFLFGGQFPGHDIIPRLYIIHVLLIPGILLALITAHLFLMFHQKHTQMPGKGAHRQKRDRSADVPVLHGEDRGLVLLHFRRDRAAVHLRADQSHLDIRAGLPRLAFPRARSPTGTWGSLRAPCGCGQAGGGTSLAIRSPSTCSAPALALTGHVLMTALAAWPFVEQWITGDKREHHVLDRPRNAPTRTALGIAGVTFYGILWLEGANDIVARFLNISLYLTTEIARYAIFIGPVVAYWVTKRICLGLQRKDVHILEHGIETGVIRQLPSGEYIEETRAPSERLRAKLEARQGLPQIEAAGHRWRRDPRRLGQERHRQAAGEAQPGSHRERPAAHWQRPRSWQWPRQRARHRASGRHGRGVRRRPAIDRPGWHGGRRAGRARLSSPPAPD